MNTIFYITRKGDIRMAELIKTTYRIKTPDGKTMNACYVFKSEEEARKALAENGGKRLYNVEDATGLINPTADIKDELKLIRLKLAVLDVAKADKSWIVKVWERITAKRGNDNV